MGSVGKRNVEAQVERGGEGVRGIEVLSDPSYSGRSLSQSLPFAANKHDIPTLRLLEKSSYNISGE